MEMTFVWTVAVLFVKSLVFSAAELPFGMTQCARNAEDLNTCAHKMINDAMSYILQGRSVLFGMLDPLPLNNLRVNAQGEDVALHVVGKQSMLRGLATAVTSNLTLDLDNMTMSFDLSVPHMEVDSTCAIHGHILEAGIYADGERFPLARMQSVVDGYSGNFIFSLSTKTNTSGTFLLPNLTLYNERLGNATLTLENVFPAGYTPGEDMQEKIALAERNLAGAIGRLLGDLLRQMVPASVMIILQLDTFEQFFPPSAEFLDAAGNGVSS